MNITPGFRFDSMLVTHDRRREHGVSLVIVLILVSLLAVLVVAFFSRVITSQKVAGSSVNTVEVSLFAQGALNTILADFKQELVDGSNASEPSQGEWLYLPKTPQNMLPERVGTADSLPNLVKRSAAGTSFFTGGQARAVDSSSLTISPSGRRMTASRWNKALLLPRGVANATSETDFTPEGTDPASGAWPFAPDWVLVARDGSNPTAWSNALRDASPVNNGFVVGRYAYAIYDEGGLLDANAAGYPSGAPTTAAIVNTPAHKPNMACADLRQLPGISDLSSSSLQDKAIDVLTKVRNYTTWDSTPATFAENYFRSVLSSPKGFMTVANTTLKDNRSDLLFSSRQDILQFFLQGMPELGSFSDAEKTELRQKLPNALQYLTHFSRSLDQPSLAPDEGRPKVVSGNGGNSALGNNDLVNPQFLKVRVTNAFTRHDGVTTAAVGEPLVKTRFALSRLAWLTFKGPIATDSGVLSTDSDLQKLITELKRRGLTDDFLKKGGPTNIRKYFGLSWDNAGKVWRYNVHNGSGSGTGIIMRLGDLPAKSRDPDFVELLKATINVGSIAKGSHDAAPGAHPANYQYKRDILTDWAILQMAANIIDQADLDGFPTRILFTDDVGELHEFRGVENLPYFYRTRVSAFLAKPGVPSLNQGQNSAQILDTGVMVVMATPEVWNPHDQNSHRCALDESGNPISGLFPQDFRIVADTTDPISLLNGQQNQQSMVMAAETFWPFFPAHEAANPGVGGMPVASLPFNGDYTRRQAAWTADTTALEFSIPATNAGQAFFREPTLLMQTNVPNGSGLQPASTNYLKGGTIGADGGRLSRLKSSGVVDGNGTVQQAPNPSGERYFGMYIGSGPAQWIHRDYPNVARVWHHLGSGASQTRYATFRVQAKDPNLPGTWATYDEKYVVAVPIEHMEGPSGAIAVTGTNAATHFAPLSGERAATAWDPRTARFGSPLFNNDVVLFGHDSSFARATQFPVTWTAQGYLNPSSANVVMTNRPDGSSGFGAVQESRANEEFWLQGLPNVEGWEPKATPLSNQQIDANSKFIHFGMIAQNSTSFSGDGRRWSGDSAAAVASGAQYYKDPDGVVRRAMGAYVTSGLTGLPLATATDYTKSPPQPLATGGVAQSSSRPIVLNRPFRSVAELGHVFSGTPWKNLSFFTPESGDGGLLDVFCINESPSDGLVAGKVSLNTRQVPVLQAILAGAYKDDLSVLPGTLVTSGASGEAQTLASKLVARTTGMATNGQSPPASGTQPLRNVSEIVGRWISDTTYEGFSEDIAAGLSSAVDQKIQRRREAPIRALASSGQTRVWNLMIDIVAQTGRYPINASSFDRFIVEAEKRLWVHVAIDRLTGRIIDQQVEVVFE